MSNLEDLKKRWKPAMDRGTTEFNRDGGLELSRAILKGIEDGALTGEELKESMVSIITVNHLLLLEYGLLAAQIKDLGVEVAELGSTAEVKA